MKRGRNYFSDGAVTDLQDMNNGEWFAIVEGNDDYEVDIRLSKNDEVLDYTCNCPFDGEICKHMIAVLYRIREIKKEAGPGKNSEKPDSWKRLISVVPENEFREFVKEYAAKNKDFRNKLMIRFPGYDNSDYHDKYIQIINSVLTAESDRHGYIDYHHTHHAMMQVSELLAKADEYTNGGIFEEAFYIAAAVAPECINAIQYMDDSDGSCGDVISDAFNIISGILQSDADEHLKNEIFEWILNQAENPDYNDYGCADELYPLLAETVDSPEKFNRIIAFFDDQIKKAALLDGWSKDYGTQKFLSLKMDVYRKTGHEEKAEEIITGNMHIHDFRKVVVEKHLADNNYDEAIRLIEEGIQIAIKDNYPGTVNTWKELLMGIYKKQNNVPKFRKLAKEFYYSGHYGINYYRQYKSTFGKEEWKDELKTIISTLGKEGQKRSYSGYNIDEPLAAVYIEEKMWGELFRLLQKSPDMHSLLRYSSYLVNDYAAELIPLYKDAIYFEAGKASDRTGYRTVVSYLLKMSEIRGGKEPAMLLKSHLLEKYHKRPAMKDELKKISNF